MHKLVQHMQIRALASRNHKLKKMLTEMTYNADMVQMLYKIPSDARVTPTRGRH